MGVAVRIRSRGVLVGAVLAVVLTASGCTGSGAQPSATATSAPVPATASASPTPTDAAAPTAAPTSATPAYSADDPGTWLIDFTGIGPFVLGQTLAAVQNEVPAPVTTCRPGVDTYSLNGLGLTAVSGIDEADPAAPVVVVRMLEGDGYDASAPQPQTVTGITLGSTVAELQLAYPDLDAAPDMRGMTAYSVTGAGGTITFEDFGTGDIQIISASTTPGVGTEYCGA